MDVKAIVAIVLTAVGVLLDIIGLAINYWRTTTFQNIDIYVGLWNICADPGVCLTFSAANVEIGKYAVVVS